jgi:two-component system sensor histidine kinase RegB
VLRGLGTPVRSRKGDGHGVGLYLTATVAKRLGGRLEAENLRGGGAEVRLVVLAEEA